MILCSDEPVAAHSPWVRVIIVNYNGGRMLQDAVDGLAAQSDGRFEVVIVDNASNDHSLEQLALPDERFRVLKVATNIGFAAANNLAAKDCICPWLATLNPDVRPHPGWLAALQQATTAYPDITMFGSTQIDGTDPERLDGCGDVMSVFGIPWRGGYGHPMASAPSGDGEVFGPCAAAALYRSDAFHEEGGFDESFFCYLEDVDLAFRFRLAGHRCVQVRGAEVDHIGSAISGRNSDFTLFHSYRNRIWLVAKNMPFPLIIAVLPLHIAATAYLLVRTRRLQNVAAPFRGLWVGICGLKRIVAVRKAIQKRRRIGNIEIARALNWSIAELRCRAIDLRSLPQQPKEKTIV